MYISEKHIKTLEFDKIRHILAELSHCEDTRDKALHLLPMERFRDIEEELLLTEEALSMSIRYSFPHLSSVHNPLEILSRAKLGSCLSIPEILQVCDVMKVIKNLCDWKQRAVDCAENLNELFEGLYPNKFMLERIGVCIKNEEELADEASPELGDIRRKIRFSHIKVREQLERLIKSPAYQSYLQEPIITTRDGRFVVPVKASFKNEVSGLVHDISASGSTYFIEPSSVVQANNEVREFEAREHAEVERILYELSGELAGFADTLLLQYRSLIALDFLFAKAELSHRFKAVRPAINENGVIRLIKARHPLIEPGRVVPIDINLGGGYTTLVITGPNTGGKTVAIKTLGLLCVMAAAGLLLPVSEQSEVAVFGGVLPDIGDEQSIEQSLSTFSSHMTNIIKIIESADDKSLVLLDELGSGTDPVEGAALAIAILEHLKERGATVIATTHYAEIKLYALTTHGVENASCEFDIETLRPTYRLITGIPGRSNAFAISSRLGLSDEIIEQAKGHISSDRARFEDVVASLEQSRQELEKDRLKAAADRVESERLKRELQNERKAFERDRDKELDRARTSARRLVETVKAQSERLITELDELRREKDKEDFSKKTIKAKSELRTKLGKLYAEADPVNERVKEDYKLPRKLVPGDTVLIADIDKKGTVIELAGDNEAVVLAGIIKTKVKLSNLRLLEGEKISVGKQTLTRNIKSKKDVEVRSELDLRGMDASEGIMELDRYIDESLLSGIGMVTIIHGKGTGVLRKAVHDHLKAHPSVRTFRLGVFGEGDTGVTIAEL